MKKTTFIDGMAVVHRDDAGKKYFEFIPDDPMQQELEGYCTNGSAQLMRSGMFYFVEAAPRMPEKRNPHVFVGRYITITRRDDGSLRPNFKPMPTGDGFSVERYALGVYNELCMALTGLVEEG